MTWDTAEQAQITRMENKLDAISAALGVGVPAPEPTGLEAPSSFSAVVNPDRTVTTTWTPSADATHTEVHEFEVDPLATLKATLAIPAGSRTTSILTGGKNYTYAVRAKNATTAELSPFSPRVTVYVPSSTDTTTPAPPPTTPPPTGTYPSNVLDLTKWTIMLPTGGQGDPDNDYIIGRSIPDTLYVPSGGGVVFKTRADGVHSSGSKYPRTEARQMADANWTKAAWQPSSATIHSLECDMAIDTRNLAKRPRVNGMQIHDGADDVCQVMRREGMGLGLMHNDGASWAAIDPAYADGTRFVCRIEVQSSRLRVYYNGVKKVDIAKTGSGWYWKFGCYMQTNVADWGEAPDAFGLVTVYRYTLAGGAV
jgi:hypothetical protein